MESSVNTSTFLWYYIFQVMDETKKPFGNGLSSWFFEFNQEIDIAIFFLITPCY